MTPDRPGVSDRARESCEGGGDVERREDAGRTRRSGVGDDQVRRVSRGHEPRRRRRVSSAETVASGVPAEPTAIWLSRGRARLRRRRCREPRQFPSAGEGRWSSITTTESRWSSAIVAATSVSGIAGGQVTTPACIASATLIESSRVLGEPQSANVGSETHWHSVRARDGYRVGIAPDQLAANYQPLRPYPAPGWSSRLTAR